MSKRNNVVAITNLPIDSTTIAAGQAELAALQQLGAFSPEISITKLPIDAAAIAAGQAELAALQQLGAFSNKVVPVHKARYSVSKMTAHYNTLVARALERGILTVSVKGRQYSVKPRNASFTGQTGYNMTAALEAALS